jgi:membrane protein
LQESLRPLRGLAIGQSARTTRALLCSTARSMSVHRSTGAAAELAFRFVHSVLWLVIFACIATSTVAAVFWDSSGPRDAIVHDALAALPSDAGQLLSEQIQYLMSHRSVWLMLGSGAGWVVTATTAFMAMTHHMEAIESDRPQRPLLARLALSVAMALGFSLLFAAVFVLFVAAQVAPQGLARLVYAGGDGAMLSKALVPIGLIAVLTLVTRLLYRSGSSFGRWLSPGALCFMTVWLISTSGFAWYVMRFKSYANAYGLLGLFIVGCTWMYVTALSLLAGAELNAALDEQLVEH